MLVDEARTPLIISGLTDPGDERVQAEQAIDLAGALDEGHRLSREPERAQRGAHAAGPGTARRAGRGAGGPLAWRAVPRGAGAQRAFGAPPLPPRRALPRARRQGRDRRRIHRPHHGRPVVGRRACTRSIEVKEGCDRHRPHRHDRAHDLPALFPPLPHTGGDDRHRTRGRSGAVARLPAARSSPCRPTGRLRRMLARPAICRTARREVATASRAARARCAEAGVPVLVGTRSVAASEMLSAVLDRGGDHACRAERRSGRGRGGDRGARRPARPRDHRDQHGRAAAPTSPWAPAWPKRAGCTSS